MLGGCKPIDRCCAPSPLPWARTSSRSWFAPDDAQGVERLALGETLFLGVGVPSLALSFPLSSSFSLLPATFAMTTGSFLLRVTDSACNEPAPPLEESASPPLRAVSCPGVAGSGKSEAVTCVGRTCTPLLPSDTLSPTASELASRRRCEVPRGARGLRGGACRAICSSVWPREGSHRWSGHVKNKRQKYRRIFREFRRGVLGEIRICQGE